MFKESQCHTASIETRPDREITHKWFSGSDKKPY